MPKIILALKLGNNSIWHLIKRAIQISDKFITKTDDLFGQLPEELRKIRIFGFGNKRKTCVLSRPFSHIHKALLLV